MKPAVRKIIHIDMDCFYAAVEQRDNPELRGKPVAVGGNDKRGVVATCSYEARAFGVKSAMPIEKARRLCPALLVLPVRMQAYREESARIQEILHRYSDLVEPVSLDEAFLDVTATTGESGSASVLAREIRTTLWKERRLTASAGIGPNPLIAKIASDWRKPNGQFTVAPEEVEAFMASLPIERLRGVGPVMQEALHNLGIFQVRQLLDWSLPDLVARFGKMGASLYRQCRGLDDREVQPNRRRKQISTETTLASSAGSWPQVRAVLENQVIQLQLTAVRKGLTARLRSIGVRMRDDKFQTRSRECRASHLQWEQFESLARQLYATFESPIRLVGVYASLGEQPEDTFLW
jgi:DNA polymerase-4